MSFLGILCSWQAVLQDGVKGEIPPCHVKPATMNCGSNGRAISPAKSVSLTDTRNSSFSPTASSSKLIDVRHWFDTFTAWKRYKKRSGMGHSRLNLLLSAGGSGSNSSTSRRPPVAVCFHGRQFPLCWAVPRRMFLSCATMECWKKSTFTGPASFLAGRSLTLWSKKRIRAAGASGVFLCGRQSGLAIMSELRRPKLLPPIQNSYCLS